MKKALFVATVDVHIRSFHLPYLKLLHDNGYEVHVATNGDEQFPNCDVKHQICIERSPFKLNNLKAIKQLKKIIDEEKFDLIHCHTPMGSVVARLAAKKARKKYGTRVIYTAHGFHFYKGAPLLNWLLFYPIEKFLARYTDTLITINTEDYELAKRKFKKCKDIQYVPGVGVDTEKFNIEMSDEEKSDFKKLLGLKEDDYVLSCVARLDRNKNQGFLINAMEQLVKEHNNIHLLLVGPDELNGYYQEMVKEKKLDGNIHFLGRRDDVPKILSITDIVVSASLREGLPVNVIEAFAAGKPVVALNCRGMKDLINDGINGFIIEKCDLDYFYNCISCLCIDKNLYNNISLNNIQRFADYDFCNILATINKIYQRKNIVLIIPTCTDLNRGDQALVLETKNIIDKTVINNECYMMSTGETKQCEEFGIKTFSDVLKHPSRFSNKKKNIKYNISLKIKWGIIASFDFIVSYLLFYSLTRKIICIFLSSNTKKSLDLFNNANYVFVKGGGFLHDYSKGPVGWYTIYYQLYHIKLAQKLNKKVFIMPNSYGPFKNKVTSRMVRNVLLKCDFISARESISSSSNTNNLNLNIDLFPDLAFFLDKSKSNFDVNTFFLKNNFKIDSGHVVAITVRPYRFYSYDNPDKMYLNYKRAFVDFIKYLTSLDYKVLLVVHTRAENDHENDEKCIDEILDILGTNKNVLKVINDNLNCYDLKKIYGMCEYVIGTRFHSVIFSLEQLIPCIAVTYGGNKGDGIMKDIGLSDYAIKIGELSSQKLIKTFDDMVTNKKNIQSKIKQYLNESKNRYDDLLIKIKKNC